MDVPSVSTPSSTGLQCKSLEKVGDQTFAVSPKDVVPVPCAARQPSTSNRRRGKTAVLTESPYKNELQKIANPQKPATLCRKSLNSKFGDAQRAKKAKYSDKQDDKNSNDSRCFYCKEKYSETKRNDDWIQCIKCRRWAHELCTGWPQKALKYFVCDEC